MSIGSLNIDVAARLLAAAGDVALVLDGEGVIRDVAIGNPELSDAVDWLGEPWVETVARESRRKVTEMLRDADSNEPRRWRQVNHLIGDGEVPIRYLALQTGEDGRIVAIGRDLRATAALQQRLLQAQQVMERDHLRLRQAESRYRLLFDRSSEAVLIVDAASRRILEANPAAEALAGRDRLSGQSFQSIVHAHDRDSAVALLGAVSAADQAAPIDVHLAAGADCRLSATLFRQGRQAYFLVHLTPRNGAPQGARGSFIEIMNRVPDAFVVTGEDMAVIAHNDHFLELIEAARSEDVVGRPLDAFIGRPGIDMSVMAAQLREHQSLRNFTTIARTRFDGQEEVEVSAVAAPDGEGVCYGFTIRTVSRQREATQRVIDTPRSVEQLTELVGRVSLKDIVRESTDLIERLCIEAALKYTSDNRASAAEILGLSRQSLYSKLNRYGLTRGDEGDTE